MTTPTLEVDWKARKIVAKGQEAIDAVRWPIRVLIVTIAVSMLIVVCRAQPITWGASLVSLIGSLF